MDNRSEKNSTSTVSTGSANNRGGWYWTDERHVHFLNSIEATFVRTMYENDVGTSLPLDRQMPDSSESTVDLGNSQRTTRSTSDVANYSNVRTDNKKKRLHSRHHDQVVPQLGTTLDERNLVPKRSKNESRSTTAR